MQPCREQHYLSLQICTNQAFLQPATTGNTIFCEPKWTQEFLYTCSAACLCRRFCPQQSRWPPLYPKEELPLQQRRCWHRSFQKRRAIPRQCIKQSLPRNARMQEQHRSKSQGRHPGLAKTMLKKAARY